MAALLAGFPVTVPAATVNRLCGSGMEAVAAAARAIAAGEMSLAIAGGVESMSRAPLVIPKGDFRVFAERRNIRFSSGLALYQSRHARRGTASRRCPGPRRMLRERRGIVRCSQDRFAFRSQQSRDSSDGGKFRGGDRSGHRAGQGRRQGSERRRAFASRDDHRGITKLHCRFAVTGR